MTAQRVEVGYTDPSDNKTWRSMSGKSPGIAAVTPAITAGAYSANDVIGGEIQLANVFSDASSAAVLHTLKVVDLGNVKANLTFVFYRADPTANIADNGAFAWGAANVDALSYAGHVDVLSTDYKVLAGVAVVTARNLGLVLSGGSTRNLWLYVTTPDAPTYASVSGLVFTFGFLR